MRINFVSKVIASVGLVVVTGLAGSLPAHAADLSVSHTCTGSATIPNPPGGVALGDVITLAAGEGADCHHIRIDKSLIDASSTSDVNTYVTVTFDTSSGRVDPGSMNWAEVSAGGMEYWYANYPSQFFQSVVITVGGTATGQIDFASDQFTVPKANNMSWFVNGSSESSESSDTLPETGSDPRLFTIALLIGGLGGLSLLIRRRYI